MVGIIDQIKSLQNEDETKEMKIALDRFNKRLSTALYLVNPVDNNWKIKVVNTDFDYSSNKYKINLKFEKGSVYEFLTDLIDGFNRFGDWSRVAVKQYLKNIVITDKVYTLSFELFELREKLDECSLIFNSRKPLESNTELLNFFIFAAKEATKIESKNKYSIITLNEEKLEFDITKIEN